MCCLLSFFRTKASNREALITAFVAKRDESHLVEYLHTLRKSFGKKRALDYLARTIYTGFKGVSALLGCSTKGATLHYLRETFLPSEEGKIFEAYIMGYVKAVIANSEYRIWTNRIRGNRRSAFNKMADQSKKEFRAAKLATEADRQWEETNRGVAPDCIWITNEAIGLDPGVLDDAAMLVLDNLATAEVDDFEMK